MYFKQVIPALLLTSGAAAIAAIAVKSDAHAGTEIDGTEIVTVAVTGQDGLESARDGRFGNSRMILTEQQASQAYSASLLPKHTKSVLNVPQRLGHGDFVWDDTGVEEGPISVWVDLRRQMISVFRNGHEIGTAVIVYGSPEKETPLGKFPILSKHRDYHSRSYDAPMPYSLFVTNDGVALHGSPINRTRATRGCVGLPIAFASKLFAASKKGDFVQIVRSVATA